MCGNGRSFVSPVGHRIFFSVVKGGITVLGLPFTNARFFSKKSIHFSSAHFPVEFATCNSPGARHTIGHSDDDVEDVYTLLGFLLFPTTWHSEDIRGFQCLRVSSGLFWRWSPYTVQGGADENP